MSTVELPIAGMTCAGCASRVERSLNGLDGVDASVNFALERAHVEFDEDSVAPEQLVAAVESAGYSATLPGAAAEPAAPDDGRRRLIVAAGLSLPVLLVSMIGALQFDDWQ